MKTLTAKLDKWLLERYPEIWLTRLHYVVPAVAAFFLIEVFIGRRLPLVTGPYEAVLWPCLIYFLPVFILIRFQYLNYQPYYNTKRFYRLFAFNTITCLFVFILVFAPEFILNFRIRETAGGRNVSADISEMRDAAVYREALAHPSEIPFLYEDSVIEDKDTADTLLAGARHIGAMYDIPLYEPGKDTTDLKVYNGYLSGVESNLEGALDYLTLTVFFLFFLFGLSMLVSAFIVNLLVNKQLLSFLCPILSIFYFGTLCGVLEPFLRTEDNDNRTLTVALIVYGLTCLVLFKSGKARVRSARKTLAIQSVAYGLVFLGAVAPLLVFTTFSSIPDPMATPRLRITSLFVLLALYGGLITLFVYYIRWYLIYSLQPAKR